jgi:hypothetical protein
MYIPPSKRPHLLLGLLTGIAALFFLHNIYQPRPSFLPVPFWNSKTVVDDALLGLEAQDYRVRDRVRRVRDFCDADDPFEAEYGRTNLRMSRAYEGRRDTCSDD